MSSEPILPPEIYDLTLSHVEDSDTLKSCSLTCYAFRAVCQKKLFSTIIFKLPNVPDAPQRFHELLLSESGPRLAGYVLTLNLSIHSTQLEAVEQTAVPLILPFFHNLRDFSLSGTIYRPSFSEFPSALKKALVACFLSNPITRLNIWQICGFPLPLLNCFSHLKQLTITLTGITEAVEDVPHNLPKGRVKLDMLNLGPRPESHRVADWLRNNPSSRLDISALTTFVKRPGKSLLQYDNIRLQDFSATLQHLIVPSSSNTDFLLELKNLPNLQVLEMQLSLFFHENNNSFFLHPQCILKTLTLNNDAETPDQLRAIKEDKWNKVDKLFAEAHLPCLQTVSIQLGFQTPESQMLVEKWLPRLRNRGVLCTTKSDFRVLRAHP